MKSNTKVIDMKRIILFMILISGIALLFAGCTQISDDELQKKIDAGIAEYAKTQQNAPEKAPAAAPAPVVVADVSVDDDAVL